jgi:hypothetical protein
VLGALAQPTLPHSTCGQDATVAQFVGVLEARPRQRTSRPGGPPAECASATLHSARALARGCRAAASSPSSRCPRGLVPRGPPYGPASSHFSGAPSHCTPVAANQPPIPVPPETNTMGATRGCRRETVSEMSASPVGRAATSAVCTLANVGAPTSSTLWQLTMARNIGAGLTRWRLPATGSAGGRTNPHTYGALATGAQFALGRRDDPRHSAARDGADRIRGSDIWPGYGGHRLGSQRNRGSAGAAAWTKMGGAATAETASAPDTRPTSARFIVNPFPFLEGPGFGYAHSGALD